ncbi:MAG: hypothetical protein GXO92_06385 [FCB group bacterium]|nr:hypothetical protein [FCB group bacterium]
MLKYTFKTALLVLLSGFLFINSCSLKNLPFNLEWYNKYSQKAPKKFIKPIGLETINSFAFNNVAIIEFTVEFLVDIPDLAAKNLTDELYKIFVETLENNTEWSIIDGRRIARSPIYRALDKKDKLYQYDDSRTGNKDRTFVSKTFSASHLGILLAPEQKRRSLRSSENEWFEAGVLNDVNGDAALKAHTVIDYTVKKGKGRLIIASRNKKLSQPTGIEIEIGYSKTSAPGIGFPEKNGEKFIYNYNSRCSFELKRPLISYNTIRSNEGVFNLEDFVFRSHEMFTIYTSMLATEIAAKL